MIPKIGTLLDAVKKPNTANKPADATKPVNLMWTIDLYHSDKINKSMQKLGGNDNQRLSSPVDQFLVEKLTRLRDKQLDGKIINDESLLLTPADRGKIKQYDHYHLKVDDNTGLYVLWYIQEIDKAKRQIRLKLSLVTLHTDYNMRPKQARLFARMPTHYDPKGILTPPVAEAVEVSPKQVLFSWLKRPLS